jgi:uncharacterized membrane protein
MGKVLGLVAGVLLVGVGVLWTAQGLGYAGGSSMTGEEQWAVIGPAVAGFGVALIWVVVTRRGS